MINISSEQREKNQSSPVGPSGSLCVPQCVFGFLLECLQGFANIYFVCTFLYTVQLVCSPKCIYLCALVCVHCVHYSSGRQF